VDVERGLMIEEGAQGWAAKFAREGLTFDDVLLLPRHSNVHP
jgi:IMP dehydrogenase/GMP reductase